MLKTFLVLMMGIYATIFASGIDDYIGKLEGRFSTFGDGKSRAFFSLNGTSSCEQIKIDKDVYYFVNETYVFECPKKSLIELNGAYGRFIDILNGWFKREDSRATIFPSRDPKKIAQNRSNVVDVAMFGYHRDPFFQALDEAVVVMDSWPFILAGLDMKGVTDMATSLTAAGMRVSGGGVGLVEIPSPCLRSTSPTPIRKARGAMSTHERLRQEVAKRAAYAASVPSDAGLMDTPKPVGQATAAELPDHEKPKPRRRKKEHRRGKKEGAALVPASDSVPGSTGVIEGDEDDLRRETVTAIEEREHLKLALLPATLPSPAESEEDLVRRVVPSEKDLEKV